MNHTTHILRPVVRAALWCTLCLSGAAAWAQAAPAPTAPPAPNADVTSRLEALAREVAELKAKLAAPAPAPVNGPDVINGAPASATPDTVWSGYGEINYNRYKNNRANDQADLRRLVLGMNRRLDARTQLVTEIEYEHAVTSADDAGEVAIEQAYVERELHPLWSARVGLFLMPAGFLNESHEPTAYYGVERNFVETAIIPSTWREGGVQFLGNLDGGWRVQAGVSTGFNFAKWDSTSAEGAESPLGATHQELAQAKARNLALFGAVNWRGLPGVQLGASWFHGGASHAQAEAAGHRMAVTLWDVHGRYTPDAWDLQALFAQGTVSGTAAFNSLSLSSGPDWYPVPKRFSGGYVQAAYRLWQVDDYTFKPFVRWERFNTAQAYADLGPGLTQTAARAEIVRTLGINIDVGSHVVLKADGQVFQKDRTLHRFNLGLGWSF
ncbi:MAG: hypothetical protein RI907_98 [Pseudomonadota bacterium]|jgi:hypothetical protein